MATDNLPVSPPVSPSVIDYAPAGAKRWQVGTLTYTTGGLVVLFCWLLWGDFAYALKDRSVANVLQVLIKKYGASDLLMSIFIISLPALYGVLVGPIVSYRSDRTRTQWGRRIPYLIVATPFAMLAMFGLGASPAIGHLLHDMLGLRMPENEITLLLFGLFWSVIDIATVTINALFNALINDVVPRQVIGRFFGLFRAFSLIAGMIFNYKIFGFAEYHYLAIFVGLGLVYGVGFTLMCLNVKEGQYPPPPDAAESEKPGFLNAPRLYLKECFANRYYLWVIIAFNLSNLSFIPVNLYNQPFAVNLHMSMAVLGKFLALTYLISLCLSYPLGSLADRFHPLRVCILTLVVYAGVTLWGGFFATNAHTFSIALVAHGVLSGVFFSGSASLTQRLFPRSRYAQFYSAYWLSYSISQVVLIPMVGKYLDLSGHNYRQAYLITSGLSVVSVLCLLEVYRRFNSFGGVKAYVAPE